MSANGIRTSRQGDLVLFERRWRDWQDYLLGIISSVFCLMMGSLAFLSYDPYIGSSVLLVFSGLGLVGGYMGMAHLLNRTCIAVNSKEIVCYVRPILYPGRQKRIPLVEVTILQKEMIAAGENHWIPVVRLKDGQKHYLDRASTKEPSVDTLLEGLKSELQNRGIKLQESL